MTSHTFTGLTNGQHTVTVRAYNKAGNYSETSITFTIDTTAPTLSISITPAPNANGSINTRTITLSYSATDDAGFPKLRLTGQVMAMYYTQIYTSFSTIFYIQINPTSFGMCFTF